MDKEILDKILEDHFKWVQDPATGTRADLSGANLAQANLSQVKLSQAKLDHTYASTFTIGKHSDPCNGVIIKALASTR